MKTKKTKTGRPVKYTDELERMNFKIPREIKEILTISAAKQSILENRQVSLTEYIIDLIKNDKNLIQKNQENNCAKKGVWIYIGKSMVINLESAREQYKTLGYPHRNIIALRCSQCNKITLVDESIAYDFCPHCGSFNSQNEKEIRC